MKEQLSQPLMIDRDAALTDADQAAGERRFVPGRLSAEQLESFCSNVVITSKYTIINFIPLFLLEQFTRFANLYFLGVCVLQMIPSVSITAGIPTSLVPLSFVLIVDALASATEDYSRHKADRRSNNRKTLCLRDNSFLPVAWKDIKVGDIVKVKRGEEFPADLVFLSSFCADSPCPDSCYVQTAQLDGETNLKLRQAIPATVNRFQCDSDCASFVGTLRCEAPNGLFDRFTGTITMDGTGSSKPMETSSTANYDESEGGSGGVTSGRGAAAGVEGDRQPYALEADQTLLRGCVLRNVDWVYGIVVYTGQETKVRVKQAAITQKKPVVELFINRNILLLVATLALCCLVGTVGYAWWSLIHRTSHTYLKLPVLDIADVLPNLATFFLLNASFIPVSLYVSMKMARQVQKFFMERDRECYYEDSALVEKSGGADGQFPLNVRTMDLNDEIGQISHVFSDKTGTFTMNYMDFRKCTVGGISYGLGTTSIGIDRRRREGQRVAHLEEIQRQMESQKRPVPHVNFLDGSDSSPDRTFGAMIQQYHTMAAAQDQDTTDSPPLDAAAACAHHFLLHLLLNHTVVPEHERNELGAVTETRLSASSPDEEAFVYFCEFMQYQFTARSSDRVTVQIRDELQEFQILNILAYNQMRKRMSVIVQHPDGSIWVYCKGADNVIYERLRKTATVEHGPQEGGVVDGREVRNATSQHLAEWGNDGLRTLCFAFKQLSTDEYDRWAERYASATGSFEENRKRKMKESNAIDDAMDEIETDLVLQGATANEDKLQEGVSEAVAVLANAGIKIWMLTGDKQETAVNIGYSTRLLSDAMKQLLCTVDEAGSVDASLALLHDTADTMLMATDEGRGAAVRRDVKEAFSTTVDLDSEGVGAGGGSSKTDTPYALIIDEKTLDAALTNPAGKESLLQVARRCKAVICCRARPDQKAEMVRLIRTGVTGSITLAIGDGANDVDMIQTAHVGVGIVGAEGRQAANAADFAIGQFRFLQKLLLVHGRWNYRRMSKLVCYMFYKNILFVLAQFWFSIYSGWSGQKFFIEMASQTFNVAYTGLPILWLAILDQDVSAESAVRFPQLYHDGLFRRGLNHKVFWGWVAAAVGESLLVFFGVVWGCWVTNPFGTPSVFEFGTIVFTAVITVVTIRVAMETTIHHWTYVLLLIGSVVSWVPFAFLFDAIDADGMQGGVQFVFGSPAAMLCVGFITALAFLRITAWKAFQRTFFPELRHLVQEAEVVTGDFSNLDAWCQYEAPQLDHKRDQQQAQDEAAREAEEEVRATYGSVVSNDRSQGGVRKPGCGLAIWRFLTCSCGSRRYKAGEASTERDSAVRRRNQELQLLRRRTMRELHGTAPTAASSLEADDAGPTPLTSISPSRPRVRSSDVAGGAIGAVDRAGRVYENVHTGADFSIDDAASRYAAERYTTFGRMKGSRHLVDAAVAGSELRKAEAAKRTPGRP